MTVGRPLPGTRVYVLDPRGRLVPPGVPGEVVIGGPGVARGYRNRADETVRRFDEDPLAGAAGEARRYRSGDRGRLLSDGRLRLLGRYDDQVKVRGFRIEPGEIEAALLEHPEVSAAAVTIRDGDLGEQRLVAHLVVSGSPGPGPGGPGTDPAGPRTTPGTTPAGSAGPTSLVGGSAVTDVELRAWLRGRLPGYLVPADLVRWRSLPLTTGGKLDRSALAHPPDQPVATDAATAPDAILAADPRPDEADPGPDEADPGPDGTHGGHDRADPGQAARLSRIWQELLGLETVDPSADFFDSGGHSLLLVRLTTRVEQEFGVRIGLAAVLDTGPTLDGLTTLLQQRGRPATRQPALVPPDTGREGQPPVFLLYPDAESFVVHRHFTGALAGRPVLGWTLKESVSGWTPGDTVADVATTVTARIRHAQPHGPYRLGGYSLGGLVAYEVAGQLLAAGERVDWLCLLDSSTPEATAGNRTTARRLGRALHRGVRGFAVHAATVTVRRTRAVLNPPSVPDRLASMNVMAEIATRASGRGHDAPLLLITSEQTATECRSPQLGWDTVHRGLVAVVQLPGDHGSMFDRPARDLLLQAVAWTLPAVGPAAP